MWHVRQGSNLQPAALETAALPVELRTPVELNYQFGTNSVKLWELEHGVDDSDLRRVDPILLGQRQGGCELHRVRDAGHERGERVR